MAKLLNANFSRLFSNGVFRICMLVSVAAGAVCPLTGFGLKSTLTYVTEGLIAGDTQYQYIDYYCFTYLWILALTAAFFCGTYVGTEYSDGTLRNKVAAGYSRTEIYFSNLIVSAAAGAVLYALYQVTDLCVGLRLLGGFHILGKREVAVYILCAGILTACVAAIAAAVAALAPNRAAAAVICIGIVLVFYVAAMLQGGHLSNAPYYEEETVINGITYAAGAENPYYVDGLRRVVSELLLNVSPGGQLILFQSFYQLDPLWQEMGVVTVKPQPGVMLLGSALLTAAAAAVGRGLFRRRELR